jgi:intracellular sulfur oxidation DsrE/DsrF family protein
MVFIGRFSGPGQVAARRQFAYLTDLPHARSSGEKFMRKIRIYAWAVVAALGAGWLAPATCVAADRAAVADARQKVIFQVSDNDPAKWSLALNNVRNIQQDLGKDNVEIEVVAYGPGLNMLKLESAVSARVGDALAQGVKIVACENTMTNNKVTKADLLPNLGYVKAGVVELMVKQQQGYSYIRP